MEQVNQNQKKFIINKIVAKYGNNLEKLQIGLWGLSFKPGTDDVREAPSLTIIESLIQKGAKIKAYDPKADKETLKFFKNNPKILKNLKIAQNKIDAITDVDLLILVTEWSEFRNIDYKKVKWLMKKPVIYDGRNIYDKNIVKREGFELYQIGV